ncbi:MAG: hypothetical protein ACR2QA_07930 [Solirubrobacteraceae bacterium]
MLPGDHQLCGGEAGFRVSAVLRAKEVFRALAQVLEVRGRVR